MGYATQQDLKDSAIYSKAIIEKAKNYDSSAFLVARGGKRFFEKVDNFLAVDYIRQVDLVEYKLNELKLYGSVYGEPMTKAQIYNELISVIENNFGKLFKKMIEYF